MVWRCSKVARGSCTDSESAHMRGLCHDCGPKYASKGSSLAHPLHIAACAKLLSCHNRNLHLPAPMHWSILRLINIAPKALPVYRSRSAMGAQVVLAQGRFDSPVAAGWLCSNTHLFQ